MTHDPHAYRLRRESEAAADLLREIASDDDDLNNDMIEGETSLLEAITAAIAEMDECDATIAGCKDREAVFSDRRKRATRRKETLRGLIQQAMTICDLATIKTATATMTIKDVPPAPLITDESLIPSDYWKQPDPFLDKTAIAAAMKDGAEIPGVTLSNGGQTIQIRRK